MAQEKITIKFEAKGDRALTSAIMRLDIATKRLQGKTSQYEQGLKKLSIQQKKVTDNTKKSAIGIKSLTGSMKMMALQAVSVVAIMQGLKKSIQMSAEMEGVKRGFDNLAKSSGFSTSAFDKFKSATDGTIDSLTLMKQANNAMLLGITDSEDQMAQMFDVSQRLGQSLGIDTVQAVESLVTGLGRQSKLMLDNLGIMVDTNKAYEDHAKAIGKSTSELTDQERKTAFVNAAMKEANFLVAQLGEEQLTTKDAMAQVVTVASDVAASLGNLLAPSIIRAAELFVGAAEAVDTYLISLKELDTESIIAKGTHEKVGEAIDANENRLKAIASLTHGSANMTARYKDEVENLERQLVELNQRYNETNMLMVDMGEAIGVFALAPIIDESIVALAEFGTLQQTKLDQYTLEQELIAGLIEANPQLAASLNLVTDASKNLTKAKEAQGKAETDLMKATASGLKEFAGSAKIAARIQQTAATIDAYRTINKIMADPALVFPTNVLMAASVGATAFANVMSISKSIGEFNKAEQGGLIGGRRHSQGGTIIEAEQGEFIMSRSAVQSVGLESLNRMNEGGGGGAVTVNVSGNVLSQDFVEGELAENIKEAIRRGTDFGIS